MSRYSLRAYESCDPSNGVRAMLFTPKGVGPGPLPMVVYIPGRGELGDLSRQFRQRAIFERVTSPAFQEKHPCFLLALSPPRSATTLLGGMPGRPTAMQRAICDVLLGVCRMQTAPRVDLGRLYLTGFSYGGCGAYALAQHFPKAFAAVVPIAALPPLPEYFDKERPGNWWHFHNEGDYARHKMGVGPIEDFARLVNGAGGDFRIGTYPAKGHDAWASAWREDAVWDWMFSKSRKGAAGRPAKNGMAATPIPVSISSAACTASVPGRDAGHGPRRAVDGLDATWYESSRPFSSSDWWQADLQKPVCGKFVFLSGDPRGGGRLKEAFVECSLDGRRWKLAGRFSGKDGTCAFVSQGLVRYLRVRSSSSWPQTVCLRRINVYMRGR